MVADFLDQPAAPTPDAASGATKTIAALETTETDKEALTRLVSFLPKLLPLIGEPKKQAIVEERYIDAAVWKQAHASPFGMHTHMGTRAVWCR